MKSPIEQIEEWLFKIFRSNKFAVFRREMDQAQRFKEQVEKTACVACGKKLLKLHWFERGPKGWEIQIICEGCHFTALVSSTWTLLEQVDSKGRAREK